VLMRKGKQTPISCRDSPLFPLTKDPHETVGQALSIERLHEYPAAPLARARFWKSLFRVGRMKMNGRLLPLRQ